MTTLTLSPSGLEKYGRRKDVIGVKLSLHNCFFRRIAIRLVHVNSFPHHGNLLY